MKKTHTFRLALGLVAGIALAGSLSSCADMWLGTSTDLNFTQPGGFGIDFGVGGPLGGPATPLHRLYVLLHPLRQSVPVDPALLSVPARVDHLRSDGFLKNSCRAGGWHLVGMGIFSTFACQSTSQ